MARQAIPGSTARQARPTGHPWPDRLAVLGMAVRITVTWVLEKPSKHLQLVFPISDTFRCSVQGLAGAVRTAPGRPAPTQPLPPGGRAASTRALPTTTAQNLEENGEEKEEDC